MSTAKENYQVIMDLMYIAANEVWFNPDNRELYGSNAVAGSNDTWERFWRLAELNGCNVEAEAGVWGFLREFGQMKENGNWYSYSDAYPDWLTTVGDVLEECGYPMYIEQLRLYDAQLADNPEYERWLSDMSDVMDELYDEYIVE